MNKQILLPASVKIAIQKAFKIGQKRLYRALNYETNSPSAKMLRAAALQRGGLIYRGQIPDGFTPACETEFDHAKGLTIQTFGNAARVVIDKTQAMIFFPGQSLIRIEGITNANWMQLLYGVQQIVNNLDT